jgi:hypothetical protein
MTRKHVVKKYDSNGKLVAEVTEQIPVVFKDLPEQTARMYLAKFPDNNVKLSPATPSYDGEARKKFGGTAARRERRSYADRSTSAAPGGGTRGSKVEQAAVTGDLSAAISVKEDA